MRSASLFSGVDAPAIALEVLGVPTIWQSETEPYCNRVLAKRFPFSEQVGDVREVGSGLASPDVLTLGFPCQDLSPAGRGEGLDGERSGLWSEGARVIEMLRPSLVLIENVPRLLGLHFERLLVDLYRCGYDCAWDVISAASAGAPHLRERLWILAQPIESPRDLTLAFGCILRRSELRVTAEGVKWPRAGVMFSGVVFESEPLVLRRTKRVDGRTYWVGDMLFGGSSEHGLWPTPHGMPAVGRRRVQGPSGNELGWAVNRCLWPTPRAQECQQHNSRDGYVALSKLAADGGLARSLMPTPSSSSYGSNQGGAAGRVGPVRHSLESMARMGLLPTPRGTDGDRGGRGDPIQVVRGNSNGHFAQSMWPTPSRADGAGGPGISEKREGGKNLRTEINEQERGMLNPDWVEWMMGLPIGHTDLLCEQPVYRTFDDEPLPRVLKECPDRRPRLQAIGNSLVWLIPYWIFARYGVGAQAVRLS